ncbi:unnamed protein product, partial [Allacma fusca]
VITITLYVTDTYPKVGGESKTLYRHPLSNPVKQLETHKRYFENGTSEEPVASSIWEELETGIVNITQEFMCTAWINSCSREAINSYIVCSYMNHLRANQVIRCPNILRVLYGKSSLRSIKRDAQFILTFLPCADTPSRYSFWQNANYLHRYEYSNFLVDLFSACGVEIFNTYLETGHQRGEHVQDCFLDAESAHHFARSDRFVYLLSEQVKSINLESKDISFDIIFIWMNLFVQDMGIYYRFEEKVKPEIKKLLNEKSVIRPTDSHNRQFKEKILIQLSTFTENLKATGRKGKWSDHLYNDIKRL